MADKWTNGVITNSGISMLGEAISGEKLIITAAALGGGTVDAAALMAQKALSQPLNVPAIVAQKKIIVGKGIDIRIQIRNTGIDSAQNMKQVGLFAKIGDDGEEKLFAIMQDEVGEEVPSIASYPDFMLEFTAVIAVNNTGNITVSVSRLAVVTMGDLEEALNDYVTSESFNEIKQEVQNLSSGKADKMHTHDDRYYTEAEINTKFDAKLDVSLKGTTCGLAELDETGRVPSSQLPSYVDDVLEYTDIFKFPEVGESGKIYIATDTNKTYRWTGTKYIEISASIALGETSSTAFRGDRGKEAYEHLHNADMHVTATEKEYWNGKAEKSDIPTTLPANGGILRTGSPPYPDYDIFSTTLSTDHYCWNKWRFVVGNTTNPDSADYIANAPATHIAGVWYEVFTGGVSARAFQIAIGCFSHQREIFIRYNHDGIWSEWFDLSNAKKLGGKSSADFVENMLHQNFHFSMGFGDHEYITNNIDSKIPNLPVVANYMHIISRDESGNVNAVISLGTDYTLDTYTYSSGSWRKINDGGNAASVGSYTEAKIAALEARIAALEGK